MSEKRKYYHNIDCLRALSFLGILASHVYINCRYEITGFLYDSVIPSCTWLVYLFMMVSGFGMCCGYYEPIKSGAITPEKFYSRRFQKIFPFFSLLVLLSLVVEHRPADLAEGAVELTMAFGLLPNQNLQVMGIGWTLGVIFLFYMLFPYFVFLIGNKKRAWFCLLVSLLLNQLCSVYFFTDKFMPADFVPKTSFLFCTPFFFAGGLLYLYREQIEALIAPRRWLFAVLCVIAVVIWYVLPNERQGIYLREGKTLVLFALILCYTIGVQSKLMDNRVFRYLGGISMELYLSHMIVFRVLEKLGLLYLFGRGWTSFLFVCAADVVLGIIGIAGYKKIYGWMTEKYRACAH